MVPILTEQNNEKFAKIAYNVFYNHYGWSARQYAIPFEDINETERNAFMQMTKQLYISFDIMNEPKNMQRYR